jgi:DHA3 family tetracycline resistance protein-like MFS transporter
MAVLRALKHQKFLLLWLGQTASRVGDFAYEIALAWWVLEKTGSAQSMSLVLIFAITPSVLFSLVSGVVIDRLPRLKVMLVSDVLRGAVALTVSMLALSNRMEIGHVFLASLLFGLFDAFFQPAYMALLPELVPEADLTSANALTSISVNLGRIVGPTLGAGIVTLVGTGWAFSLNSASFFIATALIFPLLFTHFPHSRPRAATHPWQDFREGLTAVFSRPWLWISTLVFALTNITLVGPYNVAMPFLVKDFMRANVDVLGLLYAAFPLGYVIGAMWFGRREKIRQRGPIMYLCLALAAISLALFGIHLPLWALVAAALVNGVALELEHLAWLNLLQEKIPNEQLGRVFSIDAIGSFALLPVGLALVGWGVETFGPQTMFLVGGGLTALISLAVLALSPTIRRLD